MFEWLVDPTAWLGLVTLVVLEIVLGIDNLLFIAILADKLPPALRDRARQYGLGMALGMRLVLLASISWLVSLSAPLVHWGEKAFSGRDLILLFGGFFLLFKATRELHGRLEGEDHESGEPRAYARFWTVVAQIVVLDAVFSLDAVITAIGMSDHLAVMMLAVIIAMGIMIWASRPLTQFVNQHPTLVILCLGFLLMIGFSLVAEGLGFHIPKGYLYAAIGFSILIELLNQLAQANRNKLLYGKLRRRERTAELVMRLLGEQQEFVRAEPGDGALPQQRIFAREEQDMVSRVLQLSSLPVRAVMTTRRDVEMLDLSAPEAQSMQRLAQSEHSRMVAIQDGNKDMPLGIIRKRDVLAQLLDQKPLQLASLVQQPLCLPETISVLNALEQFRQAKHHIAFVVDEFGIFEGMVSIRDIMEEIAGQLPEGSEEMADVVTLGPDSYRVSGDLPLATLQRELGFSVPASPHYHTLAGWLMDWLQHLPAPNEVFEYDEWQITVVTIRAHRIETVWLTRESRQPLMQDA